MEDSSTNPYIPQESEDIRKKVYQRQSPLGRVVKWSLIATIVVAVLVGVGLYFVIPRTAAVDQQTREKLANILQPPEQVLKRVNVETELGFKLNYDNRVFSSYAEVNDTPVSAAVAGTGAGETYENNELRVVRAYNYVRIRPVESVDSARALQPLPPQLEIFATVTAEDLTKASEIPENKGLSKLSLFVKIDTDKRLAKRVADDKTVVTIDTTKPISTNIGGVDYQKVRFTTTNDNYRVSNVKYDDCYYTIQNDQPYSICISNVRPYNMSAASLVESVFDTITFEQSAETSESTEESSTADKTSFKPVFKLAQATDEEVETTSEDGTDNGESPLISITPPYYSDAGSLSAIASTQPSVVRIGMLYCTDLTLKFESGETATQLTDACAGSLSSGVFVSKDGYIATTGHAIRSQKKAAINGYINFAPDQDAMLDRLARILDYLLKAKIILQSDAEYLRTGAEIGDQEALAKVENIASVIPEKYITAIDEEYTYAVQPTDKPIVINRSDTFKPSFAYSDTVLKAKYVNSNYDATKSIQEVFGSATPTVDVGLLKVDGSFPDVPATVNENVRANDTLNTIGFPAYSDSSLTLDKLRNLPVAIVSKVEQAYEKEGTRLILTNMPVMPGNDGAPVFNNQGELIGFAVYGLSYCPDQQCLGNGTVRSVTELAKLLDENNLKLNTGSTDFANWKNGVNDFFKANYVAASSSFASARNYQFNRWAEPAEKLATTSQGTRYDTSFFNQLVVVMIVALAALVILTILLVVAMIIHKKRINALQVGHYGDSGPTDQGSPLPPPIMNAPSVPLPPAMPPSEPSSTMPPVQPTQPSGIESPIIPIHEQKPQSDDSEKKSDDKPLSGPVPPSEDPFYK